jgi:hypothetical protein
MRALMERARRRQRSRSRRLWSAGVMLIEKRGRGMSADTPQPRRDAAGNPGHAASESDRDSHSWFSFRGFPRRPSRGVSPGPRRARQAGLFTAAAIC